MENWLEKPGGFFREIFVYHRKFSSLQLLSIFLILVGGVSWLCGSLTLFLAFILTVFCTATVCQMLVSTENNFTFLELFYLYYKKHPTLFQNLSFIYKWLYSTICCDQTDEFFEIESEITVDRFKDAVDPDVGSQNTTVKSTSKQKKKKGKSDDKPGTKTTWTDEITLLCDLITQDFIRPWYAQFHPMHDEIPEAILQRGFKQLCNRLAEIDINKFCEDFLHSYREHLHNFQEAKLSYKAQSRRKMSLRPTSISQISMSHTYRRMESVEEAFEVKFTYHEAVWAPEIEMNYIKSLVQLLLDQLFQKELQQCKSMSFILVEILSCNLFLPLVELLSDSNFLHESIIKITSYEELITIEDSSDTTETMDDDDKKQRTCPNNQMGNGIESVEGEGINRKSEVSSGERLKSDEYIQSSSSADPGETEVSSRSAGTVESVDKFAQCPVRDTNQGTVHSKAQKSEERSFTSVPLSVIGPAQAAAVASSQPKSLEDNLEEIGGSTKSNEISETAGNSAEFYLGSFDDIPAPAEDHSALTFQNISIANTETATESRSTAQYTLYEIEFDALYMLESGQQTLRHKKVKRRFREFVNLQGRLDDHSAYKGSLKDVKGPKKLLSLPFMNMDRANIENRKKLLDSFMKSLVQKPDICNGSELKEFLAYDGDAHIAFVRKVPRIDKMVKTVSEVFDKIGEFSNTGISNIASNIQRSFSTRKEFPTTTSNDDGKITKDDDNIPLEFCFVKGEVLHMEKCLDKYQEISNSDNNTVTLEQETVTTDQEIALRLSDSDPPQMTGESNKNTISLAESVLDLAVQALQERNCWVCRDRVISLVKRFTGTALNRWLQIEIDDLSSKEMCTYYLNLLRETMWPDGKFSLPSLQKSEKQKIVTRLQAKRCLEKFFPDFIRQLVDNDDYTFGIEEVLDSVQYKKLNKHFVFTMLDIAVERLFPEVVADRSHDQRKAE